MFQRFRERTRRMKEELAEKLAANQIVRAKLFVDAIVQAQEIKDLELRERTLEVIRSSARRRAAIRPHLGLG